MRIATKGQLQAAARRILDEKPERPHPTEELKPCPYCGSANLGFDRFFYIVCQDCNAFGPTPTGNDDSTARAECIELWNKRAIDDHAAETSITTTTAYCEACKEYVEAERTADGLVCGCGSDRVRSV